MPFRQLKSFLKILIEVQYEETPKMQFVTQNKQFVPRIFRGRLFVIEYAHEVGQNERQNKAKIQRRPERGMDGEDRMEGQKAGSVYLRRHGGAGSAVQPDAAVRCAGDIKLRRAPRPRGRAAGHHLIVK